MELLQPKLAAGAAAVAETTAKVEKEKEGVALVEAEVLIDQHAAEEQVNFRKDKLEFNQCPFDILLYLTRYNRIRHFTL